MNTRQIKILFMVLFSFWTCDGISQGKLIEIANNASESCARPQGLGVYHKGKTYVAYNGKNMDGYIKSYNHKTKLWSEEKKLFEMPVADYHDYPTIVIGNDEKIHLFVSHHNRQLHYYRSPNSNSIEGEWEHQEWIPLHATYTAPVVTPNGNIYVFFRKGIGNSKGSYILSTDNGDSWSKPIDIIDMDWDDFFNDRVYFGQVKFKEAAGIYPDRILFNITLADIKNKAHKDLYYLYLSIEDGLLYNVEGELIGEKMVTKEQFNKAQVLDTKNSINNPILIRSFMVDVEKESGRPVMLYAFYDYNAGHYNSHHCFWNGEKWEFSLVKLKSHPRDIEVLGNNSVIAYVAARDDKSDTQCIAAVRSDDKGASWTTVTTYVAPEGNIRTYTLIDNYNHDIKAVIHNDYGPGWMYSGEGKIYVHGAK